MTDPTTLARGLSEGQRLAILACDEREWRNAKAIGATGGTLRSLCWFWPKGANPISPCISLLTRDYEDAPLRYIYRLTPLGLAVRAHLQGLSE